ncbi:hypothetical protein [Streptomyces sp. NPDC088762]|uniref:hypothetical protein n=1 Tax=Streptomyces sp. NPDC088762 TaxID=3365891 RepID=UPI0037FA30BC
MGNIFHGSGGHDLDLTNGGTEVFVEVLMLAVSELAREPWDFRFAALLTLQDQHVMGRGVVGFGLAELDWGATRQARAAAKGFVLRVLDLSLTRHRWEELGYEPARVEEYLRTYRSMVEEFDPEGAADGAGPPSGVLPGLHEAAMASCVRHRVLAGLPFWAACVFCTAGR